MNFALILFIALVVTGTISLWDRLARRPRAAGVVKVEDTDVTSGGGSGRPRENWIVEYSKAFFPVILIVFLLRSFIVEPFRIPSGSMLPSLHIGDFILVNKFGYGLRLPIVNTKFVDLSLPERGDVMVFRFPQEESINYIKRVVGLPGDNIEYRNKRLYINGQPVPVEEVDGYAFEESGKRQIFAKRLVETLGGVRHEILVDESKRSTNMRFSVPQGHYFVMGDNRDYSNDSRYWGFVPEANIVGKAFFIWFSWDMTNGGGVVWNRIGNLIK